MVLSDKFGFLFHHVPKTGGMSLRLALRALDTGCYFDFPRKHCQAADLKNIVGNDRWEQHFTFAFVRNPWAWYVSFFNFILENPNWLAWDQEWSKIRSENPRAFTELRKLFQKNGFDYWLDKFQWSYYTPIPGQTINNVSQMDWLTIDGEVTHDRIYKLEEMDFAVNEISQVLNQPLNIPKMNSSKPTDYRVHYTEWSYNKVAEMNVELIEKYGYTFG